MRKLPSKSDFIEPHFLPLGQIVSHNAQRFPDTVALTQHDRKTTWTDFDIFSNQVANGLVTEGILAGARVAYLGKTTDTAFQIMHGAAKARAVFTPINWRLAAPEVAYILNDANVEFLFIAQEFLPLLETMPADKSFIKKLVILEQEVSARDNNFQRWRDRQPATPTNIELVGSDVVLQLYTSGTTGRPKGALITQDYVMNVGGLWQAEKEDTYDMLPGEEHLNFMPIFHTSGAISGQYLTFSRGCGIVIFPDFDLEQILTTIDQHAIPVLGAVPTMLQMIQAHPQFQQTDFSNLRYIQYGAAPMPIPLRDSLIEQIGCRFCQGYGATESLNITVLSPNDHLTDSERLLSVGKAMSGVTIKIVDEQRNELPIGEVGEIAIQSPVITAGYWNLPEATAATFADGWYLTGDGGYLDADGYLFLKERIKDLIISGGENIYPSEIENVLYDHPSVESAAVVAVADDKWGEVPLAFVVLNEGHELDRAALQSMVSQNLARYKHPKYYEALDALPLTASGKVLKKDLRKLARTLYPQEITTH